MEGKTVDLSALSERELLILLAHNVSKIENWMIAQDKEMIQIKLELARVKTQMRIWAGLSGVLGGGVIALIVNILTN